MPKVLIADKMDEVASEIFKQRGITVDSKAGLTPEEIIKIVKDYDGIAVRSSTKINADIIGAATNCKVIGRAGIGVDTIDVPAATNKGVVVMNTPFGNSITTAEHTIAMMMACARQIPQANASTHAGKWEKSKFMGVELFGKTLGVIGCGNIGAIVASRAIALQMRVVAFDPFLTEERAVELGVKRVTLDELLVQADFITLHVPKTTETANMLNKETLAKTKKGVRIINCARGGLVVEEDLKALLDSGHVAAAAFDVFSVEPATENVLFNHPNIICTPHLGASTGEAQVNVAIQVAEQMSDFLLSGAVANAVNMPSISAEEAPRLRPYMALVTQLGKMLGQINKGAATEFAIEYLGHAAQLNPRPLTACALAAYLSCHSDSVNMVNAPQIAKTNKLAVRETREDSLDELLTAVRLSIKTENGEASVTGTLFGGGAPRLVAINDVPCEAALTEHMLFILNEDKPGLIGRVGTILGEAKQNIADFRLGRQRGGTAIALISLDVALSDKLVKEIAALPQVKQVNYLKF
ncbi:MAG: phosphoglycerate dehydrogenase [Alphaproteobacteria bacterium]|nr:phosphoglycerate dehydrogenase [Alphaproteobacteria bacterium]